MKARVLAIFLLILVIFVEGCVSQSSNTQTVGENGTAILNGKYPTTIILQPGEKLYYIEGCGFEGFCDNNIRVGKGIANFSRLHNITKIEIQRSVDGYDTGAYVIYK